MPMNHDILCVVCAQSAANISSLLASFGAQADPRGHDLLVQTYRGLDKYPSFTGSGAYRFAVFVREGCELYGTDFISRLVEPLERDHTLSFSIPSTVIHQDAPYYQIGVSLNEKAYGIPLCNVTTGFAHERYGIFSLHNVLAIAMRYELFQKIQDGHQFIVNPADFSVLPSLMDRFPGGAVVAPRCAVYMPSFANFTELWKLFYNHGKRDAWFNSYCRRFQAGTDARFHSFYSAAYYCGYARQKASCYISGGRRQDRP